MSVEPGQLYKSNDPREQRVVAVISASTLPSSQGYAWVRNTKNGRRTHIKISRLEDGTRNGYTLLQSGAL